MGYFGSVRQYFGWVGVRGGLFWVGRGDWGLLGHYFGWVEVSGALFWEGGDEWDWVGMSGVGWE